MACVASDIRVTACLLLALAACAFLWAGLRHDRATWLNVPPAPSPVAARLFGLNDSAFAYRSIGLMLQNMGDTGGRATAFKQYDYANLAGWLNLENDLDPRSNYAPYLAAYYYGAVDDPAKAAYLVDYLVKAGHGPGPEKWRFLAQAVYIARFRMKDLDRAYRIAIDLSGMKEADIAPWARQLPAFIMQQQGDTIAARGFMLKFLQDAARSLPVQEVNAIKEYICRRDPGDQTPREAFCSERP